MELLEALEGKVKKGQAEGGVVVNARRLQSSCRHLVLPPFCGQVWEHLHLAKTVETHKTTQEWSLQLIGRPQDVDIKTSQQPARFHSTSTLINQTLGTALGNSGRRQVLESLRAVDLSSSRSSGPTPFPAKERPFHGKGPETPSALGLGGMISSFSSQTHSATVREASSGTRETRTGDLDNWDSMGSERLGNTGKEISSRQLQQPEKQKLPASFLQALSSSQREKHPAEFQDHQALPLLPSLGLPTLPGQSSNGVFSRKSFVPHIQAEGFSIKGTESRSNLSSTYPSELDKRRLRMGLGMSKRHRAG